MLQLVSGCSLLVYSHYCDFQKDKWSGAAFGVNLDNFFLQHI